MHIDNSAPTAPTRMQRWFKPLHVIEDATLVIAVVTLVVISLLQIALRNFADSGLAWGESATQMLVLWCAWLGALRASRDGQHVAVDIIAHYTEGRTKLAVSALAMSFSAAASLAAAWFCIGFVTMERNEGTTGLLGMPMWYYESIIPFALTLIGVRFVLQLFRLWMHRDAVR